MKPSSTPKAIGHLTLKTPAVACCGQLVEFSTPGTREFFRCSALAAAAIVSHVCAHAAGKWRYSGRVTTVGSHAYRFFLSPNCRQKSKIVFNGFTRSVRSSCCARNAERPKDSEWFSKMIIIRGGRRSSSVASAHKSQRRALRVCANRILAERHLPLSLRGG